MARTKAATTHPEPPAPANGAGHIRLPADQRREQLIETAIDLFSRKGFNGTTTREIAAAAGVTEAIIFRHFETKEHLYKAIIDRKVNSLEMAGWIAQLRASMDRNDDEAVVGSLMKAIIWTHKTDPKFERLMLYAALEGNEFALIHMERTTSSIVDVFRRYFARRQKQGVLRGIDPDTALMAIAGMAKHYAMCRYVHEFREQCLSADEAVDAFTEIAMRGLSFEVPATGKSGQPSTKSARKKK